MLKKTVEEAAHYLPAQGPLTVFIHHNTLHAFEHLPFEEAVVEAGRMYGCQPFMSLAWYRQRYAEGRILDRDLDAVLERENLQPLACGVGAQELWRTLLLYPLVDVDGAALDWQLDETGALWRFHKELPAHLREQLTADALRWADHRDDLRQFLGSWPEEFRSTDPRLLKRRAPEKLAARILWAVCHSRVASGPASRPADLPVRPRDRLVQAGEPDPDELVHPFLIAYCAGYLDQGVAERVIPGREEGMYPVFRHIFSQPAPILPGWLRKLPGLLARQSAGAEESVLESLTALGITGQQQGEFIRETLLGLRGWAGMIHQAEVRPDRMPGQAVPATLMDFLAVRLLLDRLALEHVLNGRSLAHLPRPAGSAPSAKSVAFRLFKACQFLGIGPTRIESWTDEQLGSLLDALQRAADVPLRRLFHLAYERRFQVQTLDALMLHAPAAPLGTPKFQAIFCVDEREESARRHLEEVEPGCETFGALGYFSVPMYYRGANDSHEVPLCPVGLRPQHVVVEVPRSQAQELAERQAAVRRSLGHVAHTLEVGSKSLTWGTLLTSSLGFFSAAPALFRVLFPFLAGRVMRRLRRQLTARETQLQLLRHGDEKDERGRWLGFSVSEMADIVGKQLRSIGLTRNFAPLVLIVGHGSSSMNNPHEAAYDCGACGGARGGPNARAFAWMANWPPVRESLAREGLVIPPETRFVGAFHNTCDEDVELYDLGELTPAQLTVLESAAAALQKARERDALERCRRFESAPLEMSPESALLHVEERSEDLAQPRPECGHATNACCLIGRRLRSKGLFLDRRAFLSSYDPDQDDAHGHLLEEQLRAVVPVGAGINLEYYFSYVDNYGYGSGTKLPHNIASLLGVMNGTCSDLRTGLPWQMVEIHEPLRLLTVIETRPETMEAILQRNPGLSQFVLNQWVVVALLDPHSQQMWTLQQGRWSPYRPEKQKLPTVDNSEHWFRKHREHLEFAEIR